MGAPQVVGHVRRDALLDRLTLCTSRAPLTWIVALPGAGKTSAVARWILDRDLPAVWYRVAHDDDGARWLDALREGLSDRHALPVWSPENQIEPLEFARSLFSTLKNDALTLVLDDCHRVGDASELFSLLSVLPEVCGAGTRCVLISRRAPPPVLSRGLAAGWLSVVDDLRLTDEEAAQIAEARGHRPALGELRSMLQAADGWLAHLLALCQRPSSRSHFRGDHGEQIGDFLAAELLESLPAAGRDPLRRLAELPEIPKDAGARLMAPEVRRLLATLSAQRYFVDETDDHFRLHDLLRDALLRRNEEKDTPDELRAVRRELATRVRETMPEAAMRLRAVSGDTAGALELLDAHAQEWFRRGLHRTIQTWLQQLPDPADSRERAALALYRAQALLPLEPEAARPVLASARRLSIEAGDSERAYLAWSGEVSSYVIQWGAVHGLADLVDDLQTLHEALGPPSERLSLRTSSDALTALMYGRPEDSRLGHFARLTAQTLAHAPDAGVRIGAAAQLLIYKMWWVGDFPGGRALYETFDAEVSEGEHLPPLARLLWWSCASIVDWQCGSAEECHRKVERGLALAESTGVHVRDFFLLTQGIFCALSWEDWTRAERYLVRLGRTERNHKRLDAMVHHFFRSWYSLARGDARAALAHAENAWPLAKALGSTFHKVIVLSALAPARVHCGDIDGAERAYRMQLALAKAASNPTFSFIAFCAGVEIAMARGDEAGTAKQVERILMVKHLGGFHSGCGWRTPMMQAVLSFALRKGILPDVARLWIKEKKIPPPEARPDGWPLRIRIDTRGGLTVHVDGGEASPRPGTKTSRKLRELVAALATDRAGATHADLADWLWPDAEGDRAAASLKVAIHRARQWLGHEAIRVEDGRAFLNPSQVECDLWQAGGSQTANAERVLYGFDAPPIRALRRRLSRS